MREVFKMLLTLAQAVVDQVCSQLKVIGEKTD